ncbi:MULTISPECIES: DUF2167 domain-containing protein [unclassified Sphingomonas]|uniref:DUF2167 domain-containing protein n=1 Tax=unclassified Sphingomonas TaxID=196159 RepID=UPI0007000BDF|nr:MULTISPECIES: DUF2167 domain-containing protein [unclassified Sphingomonas]KQX20144.1 hypothetical protein ASD17_09670 [Sphingomonas sp. Root1294]KQY67394.1 hypothetical protein ASD39_09730 [Sphingomonas sp. Root50]KRB90771.1 hypothetical protein ASE22_10735 [Sphingomonas sp. Root720]
MRVDRSFSVFLALFMLMCTFGGTAPGLAQSEPTTAQQAEMQAAWNAAAKTATRGPADVKLLDQASLKIKADQVFVPAAEADKVMRALGNPSQPGRQGLIVAVDEKQPWLVDVTWTGEGYVRDGEAKEWKSDALLEALKEGTEKANEDRTARGYAAIDVVGWVEEPHYDAVSHRLVWSLSSRVRGAPASLPQTINYNTFALGREGYFSLNLITVSNRIAADKHVATQLLAALSYIPGKRYADFDESTDKVAAYGIGALVGIVAAKKLGLLAVMGLLLVKAWKLVIVAIVAIGAILRRIVGRNRPTEGVVAESGSETLPEAAAESDVVDRSELHPQIHPRETPEPGSKSDC